MKRFWVQAFAVLSGLAVLYLIAAQRPGSPTFTMEPSPYSLAADIENSRRQIPEPFILPEQLPPMLIALSHQRVNDRYYELYLTHESAGTLFMASLCVGELADGRDTTCNQRNGDVIRETTVEGRQVTIVVPGRPLDDSALHRLRRFWETVPLTTDRPDWLDHPIVVTDPDLFGGEHDVLPTTPEL